MASIRVVYVLLSGVCLGACGLPVPDYKVIEYPAPYRKESDGAILENEDLRVDAEGYRLDKNGARIGAVDIQAKTAGDPSNAMAGYYISSRGANESGTVMAPSEGAASGAGYGPGSVNPMPPATGQPVPLTPLR